MRGWRKNTLLIVIVVVLALTTAGGYAIAQDEVSGETASAEGMIADFIFLRPLGIVATGVGTVFFCCLPPFYRFGWKC